MQESKTAENLGRFQNKYIRIFLKNNITYSGQVISTSDNSIVIIDRYGSMVCLNFAEIRSIEEFRNVK